MLKTISGIFVAAAIVGAVSLFYGSDVIASAPAAIATKGDRADLEQSCDRQSWPYYQNACIRDDTRNAGRATKVRLISTDRVPQTDPNTDPNLAPYWPGMISDLQYVNPAFARRAK